MSIKVVGRIACCLLVVLLGILAVASPPAVHYHLLKKVPLGAAAGGGREYFDYVTLDSKARRVYASHGTEVKVADADSGAVVGTISGLKQCHGIALVEELGKGFISDGGAAKTIIFDTATLKVTGEVKTFGPGIGFGAIEREKLTDELIVPIGELKVAIRLPQELQSADRLTFDFLDGSFVVADN